MLKWTKDKPATDGFYFYKGRSVSVVRLTWRRIDYRDGGSEVFLYCETCGHHVQEMKGKWAGPIDEPKI